MQDYSITFITENLMKKTMNLLPANYCDMKFVQNQFSSGLLTETFVFVGEYNECYTHYFL